jgi:hypothetical protein
VEKNVAQFFTVLSILGVYYKALADTGPGRRVLEDNGHHPPPQLHHHPDGKFSIATMKMFSDLILGTMLPPTFSPNPIHCRFKKVVFILKGPCLVQKLSRSQAFCGQYFESVSAFGMESNLLTLSW